MEKINDFDFRLIKRKELPIMNDKVKKDISKKINGKYWSNSNHRKKFVEYMLSNFTNKCAYCGTPLEHGISEEVDHFIPKTDENMDEIGNLVLSCRKCNNSKSDETFSDDFYPYSQRYSELFSRNDIGQIVPTTVSEDNKRFANKLKFRSIYHTVSYIVMLIDVYLQKCDDIDLCHKMIEFKNELKKRAKILEKRE